MRHLLVFAAAIVLASSARAQNASAKLIQERFDAAKPDAKRLAFYSLDWAMSLEDAKERAAKEHRPILVILNTNITAGTNFFSGHT